ncbi:acyl-CoA/acyl-ACP dehydrogenase [Bradyrhizobium sp. U87765 SZCCT0131]|uniref:acyl-CoA dehydrogenase family protein n=1 Tax=unclassified Bradyrhizobium TaxID=2631580 RepID=UPI001BA73001|nr:MULTISPECIES: acyl-CoA dehydrogenase family protein [unclassified Bradyrhizobium]MBR1221705.1 acyl-CoA/acyl-ACP dehydrogenase [Bradyrhizobium sp. U87765 SZCCT0131]MBR1264372.1 acyl-CoA/acyl-ACP dehydrogenase [Bradyrhizobium sp. U87765 SZCCT0134]MBR1304721.1 acyl-CoA/acyl-ACP dehydrogenase [Bradyrhizobium sp. U87765 SZCCT0110]MBR1322422.1 acyl-CoA/acyl-ACP dehydrogenase [Bradyrhizobium sp. U87765 SZCCT0109]MBR1346650.1 acyl-CoA/acyl-ACP dehydrogenase [Bradyrhizobium sp. U87765 SZCCT0048]
MSVTLPSDLSGWLEAEASRLDTTDADAGVLPRLAQAGLFRIGVPAALGGSNGDVRGAVEAIAAVSRLSLAAGFVFWGHRTFIEYLLQSPNAALRDRLLPDLLAGRRAGATGLSNAMKFLSGLEPLQVRSRRAEHGLRIDGKLPWVTNLQPAGFDVAAAIDGDGHQPAFVASLASEDEGLARSPDLDLMAMRATSTAAIDIDDVRIGTDRILHPNASVWLPKVRPAFLGLQCAMAIGLAERALLEVRARLAGGRDILAAPADALANDLERATAELLAGLPGDLFVERPAELFRIRIRLAEIANDAVQLELSATGGKAYLCAPGAGFQRRLREVAFIPIITPSLVQLKTALNTHERRPVAAGSTA